jgi:hypothetical protein
MADQTAYPAPTPAPARRLPGRERDRVSLREARARTPRGGGRISGGLAGGLARAGGSPGTVAARRPAALPPDNPHRPARGAGQRGRGRP